MIHDGEPTFTLVAHDLLAPDAIRQWERMARRLGVAEEKCQGAIRVAEAMEAWQRANADKVKYPD